MVDRAERSFTDEDIAKIASTYHAWRGTPSATEPYADDPGFCASASLATIREFGFALTPGRYVGSKDIEADDTLEHQIQQLTSCLLGQLDQSRELSDTLKIALGRVR